MYDRDSVVAEALYSELQKIAAASADDIARATLENLALRRSSMQSVPEMLSFTGRSALGGLLENAKLSIGGWNTRRKAYGELKRMRKALNVSGARTLEEQNERLAQLSKIRDAERQLALPGDRRSFFSRSAGSSASGRGSSMRNIAFGAGLGGAGLLAAQHYLTPAEEPQY